MFFKEKQTRCEALLARDHPDLGRTIARAVTFKKKNYGLQKRKTFLENEKFQNAWKVPVS